MTKEQERQQERKLEYFIEWLEDDIKDFKKYEAYQQIREAMIDAYLRGRGDKYDNYNY